MHKPNETQKILCDFKVKTHHQMPTRRLDFVLINMTTPTPAKAPKNLLICGFCRFGRTQSKNEKKG